MKPYLLARLVGAPDPCSSKIYSATFWRWHLTSTLMGISKTASRRGWWSPWRRGYRNPHRSNWIRIEDRPWPGSGS